MVAVLIHPSGVGNAVGAKNWRNTIESPVDYRQGSIAAALTSVERRTLENLHPSGLAPMWGAHRYHSARMAELAPDDVVVFTGKKKVLAVGRIGLLTDNPELGDELWRPHPDHGSFRHVYSLLPLTFTDMPQPEFRARGGFSEVDDFRALRVLRGAQAEAFVAEFADVVPESRAVASPVERSLGVQEASGSTVVTRDVSRGRGVAVDAGGNEYGHRSTGRQSVAAPTTEHEVEARSAWEQLGRLLLPDADTDAEVLARLAGFIGSTDAVGTVQALRREQGLLRESLGIGASRGSIPAQCGLCGRHFPRTLLVAAHVKPRSECTEEERLDMPHVAMAACLLGCDALFEAGLVAVDTGGRILVANREQRQSHLYEVLRQLDQRRRAPAWTEAREPYFAWHRERRFLDATVHLRL